MQKLKSFLAIMLLLVVLTHAVDAQRISSKGTMCLDELFSLFPHILMAAFLRYFIPAGLAFVCFRVLFKKRFAHRFIHPKKYLGMI